MTTEYIEKEFEVRIYYIQTPENYDMTDRKTQCFLDITKLNYLEDLWIEQYWNEFKGYRLVHMEIKKADMVHLEALYQRFQENGIIRSMMIGDLIQINDKFYIVSDIGFTELKGLKLNL